MTLPILGSPAQEPTLLAKQENYSVRGAPALADLACSYITRTAVYLNSHHVILYFPCSDFPGNNSCRHDTTPEKTKRQTFMNFWIFFPVQHHSRAMQVLHQNWTALQFSVLHLICTENAEGTMAPQFKFSHHNKFRHITRIFFILLFIGCLTTGTPSDH